MQEQIMLWTKKMSAESRNKRKIIKRNEAIAEQYAPYSHEDKVYEMLNLRIKRRGANERTVNARIFSILVFVLGEVWVGLQFWAFADALMKDQGKDTILFLSYETFNNMVAYHMILALIPLLLYVLIMNGERKKNELREWKLHYLERNLGNRSKSDPRDKK